MVNIYNSRSWYGQNKNKQQLFIPGSNTEGLNKGNNKITSEQSYKGKVKTHNYINRQNQSTTGKLWKP
jgi:hypothetical protein